ncbi:MAG: transglutaminase-like domain-containing protein [Gemmatimonadales bacterium]
MTRGRWAAAILAIWVVALGWLAKRELFQSTGARLAEAALSVPPGATFYRFDLGGQQVGFGSSTVDTLPDSIRVEDFLVLDVPVLGRVQRTSARSTAMLTRALRLRRFDASFDGDVGGGSNAVGAGGGRFDASGEVVGDSVLRVTLVSAGDTQVARVPLPQPIVLPALLPLRLAFGGRFAVGRTFAIRLFDPTLLAEQDVRVRIAAESTLVVPDSAEYDSTAMAWVPAHFDTVRAFRIEQAASGFVTTAWIDPQGKVVQAAGPVGFTISRSAFEIAYENFRRRDTARVARASARPEAGAIVAATALAAGVLARPDTQPRFQVRLGGVDLAGFDITGGRQRLRGDTLVVERERLGRLARVRLPVADTALAPYLAPEPLIQSADPRIAAQARQIVGRERDAARVAERLTHWVYGHLTRGRSAGAPSAVQALERRRGDCNEHTALFVALARAAGLPARTAAGLVFLEGRFYYHAWPEVHLGQWVAVDPTFDQVPADAVHLRFTIGGFARQVELVRHIGTLTLEAL